MSELTYTRYGDYFLPDLVLPEQKPLHIGKYGLRRKHYLKTHRRIIYINLLTTGALNEHLSEIDQQAMNRMETLIPQMATVRGITEAIKATDQMAWVGAMNNIRASVEEIVLNEIVYA